MVSIGTKAVSCAKYENRLRQMSEKVFSTKKHRRYNIIQKYEKKQCY